jgi:hypothetical protein
LNATFLFLTSSETYRLIIKKTKNETKQVTKPKNFPGQQPGCFARSSKQTLLLTALSPGNHGYLEYKKHFETH